MKPFSPYLHCNGLTMRLDWLGWSRFFIAAQRRKQGMEESNVSLLLIVIAVVSYMISLTIVRVTV
jgi:hypothetical protein